MVTKEEFENKWKEVKSNLKTVVLITDDIISANRVVINKTYILLYRNEYNIAVVDYKNIKNVKGD
jgi:hypothetical protein